MQRNSDWLTGLLDHRRVPWLFPSGYTRGDAHPRMASRGRFLCQELVMKWHVRHSGAAVFFQRDQLRHALRWGGVRLDSRIKIKLILGWVVGTRTTAGKSRETPVIQRLMLDTRMHVLAERLIGIKTLQKGSFGVLQGSDEHKANVRQLRWSLT